jgi:hypothetical protein
MAPLLEHGLLTLICLVISFVLERRRRELDPKPAPLAYLIRKLIRDVVPASLLSKVQSRGNQILPLADGAFVHCSSIILYIQ